MQPPIQAEVVTAEIEQQVGQLVVEYLDPVAGCDPPLVLVGIDRLGWFERLLGAAPDLLLLGSGLDVRPNALIASLDLDGDNAISEEEFLLSMSNVSR